MQVVTLALDCWDGQWMNRQHLMWAMRDHVPVLYVQEPEAWYMGLGCRTERFFRPKLEKMAHQLSILRLPKVLSRRCAEGRWNRWTYTAKARLIQSHLDRVEGPVVWYNWHPQLWPYQDYLARGFSVYHVFDIEDEYFDPEYKNSPEQRGFVRACREADLVVAGTPLQASVMPAKNVAIVPNAVPWRWYQGVSEEPEDIAVIPRPRIGYVGAITAKVNLDWIDHLANETTWHIVLVGPVNLERSKREHLDSLRTRQNVHCLGTKDAIQVPAYVKGLDVGLMCYERGLHCERASPLKLFEYCAAGLPIVGSRLPSLSADPEASRFTVLVDTPMEATEAVRDLLRSGSSPIDQAARKEFAMRNSWERRAVEVLNLVKARL